MLKYKDVLKVCKDEIPGIHFFDNSRSRMPFVRESRVERFKKAKALPGTRSSHHFLPTSPSTISHYLTSGDPDPIATFDFKSGSKGSTVANPTVASFITCVYDSFWWDGLVEDINPELGDMEFYFYIHKAQGNHSLGQQQLTDVTCHCRTYCALF